MTSVGTNTTPPSHTSCMCCLLSRCVPCPCRTCAAPAARTLDAAARQLDTRTADQKITAELVRIVDALQAVVLRLDTIEERLREVRG